jgi:hypothetical protein
MKRAQITAVLVAAGLFVSSGATVCGVESDEETKAHKAALDLAGAFSNDGFKLRDGSWSGAIQSGSPKIIQVNLYAGNEYWFSLGRDGAGKEGRDYGL